MAKETTTPQLTAENARAAMKALLEQERMLRYESFGAYEALELGRIAASLAPDFGEGISVTITREADGVRMFQWVADDKNEKNLLFADGKRKAALKAGHASPWTQLEATVAGAPSTVWTNVPDEVPRLRRVSHPRGRRLGCHHGRERLHGGSRPRDHPAGPREGARGEGSPLEHSRSVADNIKPATNAPRGSDPRGALVTLLMYLGDVRL